MSKAQISRVLVEDLMRMVHGPTPGGGYFSACVSDSHAVEHLVAVLVPLGATRIVMPKDSLAGRNMEGADRLAAQRVDLVNGDWRIERKVSAILAPVLEDRGIEFTRPPFAGMRFEPHFDDVVAEETFKWTWKLWFDLYTLILGIEYQLQIQLDLVGMKERLEALGSLVHRARARIVIAELRAVVNSYRTVEVPELGLIPGCEVEMMRQFDKFVRDAEYAALSRETVGLGVPGLLKRSSKRMGNLVRALARRDWVAKLATIGSRVVAAVTSAPDVTDDVVGKTILKPRYLPPIVDLSAPLQRTRLAWLNGRPETERVSKNPYS